MLQTTGYGFEDISQDRERKSPVWLHFLMNKKQELVRCRYCSQEYLYRDHGSTSNLAKHLLSVHNVDVRNPIYPIGKN